MSVDYPDYQTPQAHATAISITGAPLLNLSGKLDSGTPTVPITGSFNTLTLNFNQPAYEIFINAQFTAAGAAGLALRIRLSWFDQATAFLLDQQDFNILPAASVGQPHTYTIRGLTKANQLVVSFFNNDTVSSVTVQYGVFQHSRVVPRDIGKTETAPALPAAVTYLAGFGRPNSNEVLDFFQASLAGGSSVSVIASAYSGQVGFWWGNGSSTNVLVVAVYDILDFGLSAAPIFQGQQDSNGNGYALVSLPRNEVIVKATMTGSTAHGVQMKMVATELQN